MIPKWILGGYKGRAREDIIGVFGVWLCFHIHVWVLGALLGNGGRLVDHSFFKLEGDNGIVVVQECSYSQALPGVFGGEGWCLQLAFQWLRGRWGK